MLEKFEQSNYNANIESSKRYTYSIAGNIIISSLFRTVKKYFGGDGLFYDTLKEICDKKHTSPSAVALAIGISKSNVTEWKKGKSPKLDTVIKIANYLSINPARLIPKRKDGEREGT